MILVRWAIHLVWMKWEGKKKTSLDGVEHSAFLMWRAILGCTEILEKRIGYAGNQYTNRTAGRGEKKKIIPLYGLQWTSLFFESFVKDMFFNQSFNMGIMKPQSSDKCHVCYFCTIHASCNLLSLRDVDNFPLFEMPWPKILLPCLLGKIHT